MRHHLNFTLLSVMVPVALLCLIVEAGPQQAGQPPKPEPAQTQEQDEGVVRITTQLVQIDAVVTDKKGEHVDDLSENDFELFVDGKKQKLSYFHLIRLPEAKRAEAAPAGNNPAPPTVPTKPLAQEQVRRVIAFVVDDLGLSFESTYYAREALKKFVNTQMQDGDLVAIIRTGRGLGALQQFTNDKRILLAAIEKLVWNPQSRNMMPRFGSVDNGGDPDNQGDDRIEDFRETVFTVGTLGALNFVVRGMHELPGRKLAVLVSDGFPLFKKNGDNELVLQRLRRLVDLANRSSVVIYSLDAKG